MSKMKTLFQVPTGRRALARQQPGRSCPAKEQGKATFLHPLLVLRRVSLKTTGGRSPV